MEKQKLVPTIMKLGKNKKGQINRPGYQDSGGQVFAPPKNEKRSSSWKKKMTEKGFEF